MLVLSGEVWSDGGIVDVSITYSPVAAESKINTTFDDVVEYRKRSAAEGSRPSTGQSFTYHLLISNVLPRYGAEIYGFYSERRRHAFHRVSILQQCIQDAQISLSSQLDLTALLPRANGSTFDWQGSSYLFFVHSQWEVLGYGTDTESNLEWAVTCEYLIIPLPNRRQFTWFLR